MIGNYEKIGWATLIALSLMLLFASCGHQPPGEDLWKMV